jgi:hypothetical protein
MTNRKENSHLILKWSLFFSHISNLSDFYSHVFVTMNYIFSSFIGIIYNN